MKTQDEQRTKKYLPGFVSRHWQIWLCSLCFAIPFIVGGSIGWAYLLAEYDIGSQGLTGTERTREMVEFRNKQPIRFIDWGLKSGVVGLLIGLSCSIALRKKSSKPMD